MTFNTLQQDNDAKTADGIVVNILTNENMPSQLHSGAQNGGNINHAFGDNDSNEPKDNRTDLTHITIQHGPQLVYYNKEATGAYGNGIKLHQGGVKVQAKQLTDNGLSQKVVFMIVVEALFW